MISLNVGGRSFLTTESTLRKGGPGSFFARLLDNRQSGRIPTATDSSGALFIDRDPAPFERILSFLRSNIVNLDSEMNAEMLLKEAEFYCVESLINILRPPPPSPVLENGHQDVETCPHVGGSATPHPAPPPDVLVPGNATRQPGHNNVKICKFYALLDPSKYECPLSTIIERCFSFYMSRVAVITRQIEEHEWFVTVLMQDCVLDKRGLQKLISICLACGITNFTFYDGVELTENSSFTTQIPSSHIAAAAAANELP